MSISARHTFRCLTAVWLCAGLLLLAGCSTHADRLRQIRTAYYSGDLDRATALIGKETKKRKGEGGVLQLEQAMVDLALGRPAEAERTLRIVRDRFDDLEQKDLGEAFLSTLSDDTKRAYSGEDYEKILIRCFLALSNLMHDGSDAGAYALQVGDKQRQIMNAGADPAGTNPKLSYRRVAFGAYLHAALQEGTHLNYDEAARSIQLVANWEPDFAPARRDLERLTSGRHSEPGHGVLYVITLVGRGPFKEERAEPASSAALLIADRILSVTGKHSLPPTIAPVKIPVIIRSRNPADSVVVEADDRKLGQTETITDISRMAVEQHEAVMPQIMARAVVRRVVKKGSVYAAKEAAKVSHPAAEMALDLAGVAWEATEAADTRCWGLLPDRIQVLRVELPAGTHKLRLTPASGNRPAGETAHETVTIEDGRNTFIMATFPDTKLVGQVLSHTP